MTNTVRLRITNLPLKEMDSSLLTHAILESTSTLGMDKEAVTDALVTASYYHRKATRSNRANLPRTHYVEHPLRNALRLLRYGVTNQDIIIATILHDVAEDCAHEITNDELGVTPLGAKRSEIFEQSTAFVFIEEHFGADVEDLVWSVTNPASPKKLTKEQKRLDYIDHVEDRIFNPETFLVKFSDWADNAVGLHHNATPGNESMIQHLAAKYLPLADIFEERLERGADIRALVSEEGHEEILSHIESGRKSLTELLK